MGVVLSPVNFEQSNMELESNWNKDGFMRPFTIPGFDGSAHLSFMVSCQERLPCRTSEEPSKRNLVRLEVLECLPNFHCRLFISRCTTRKCITRRAAPRAKTPSAVATGATTATTTATCRTTRTTTTGSTRRRRRRSTDTGKRDNTMLVNQLQYKCSKSHLSIHTQVQCGPVI